MTFAFFCLDTVSVLNRTNKDGYTHTPYELFTGEQINYDRDYRCRWGELVIVKKPEGISSDLKGTGEWAMVVRRFMNKTGVLEVFLIGSRKYAYRLSFQGAKVPEWVIIMVSPNGEKVIMYEDQAEETIYPVTEIESGPILEDPIGAQEHMEDDYGDVPEHLGEDDIEEVDEAIRVLEKADLQANFEEEQREEGVHTRARVNPERFQKEV